jgi:hypothetical protein
MVGTSEAFDVVLAVVGREGSGGRTLGSRDRSASWKVRDGSWTDFRRSGGGSESLSGRIGRLGVGVVESESVGLEEEPATVVVASVLSKVGELVE